ncbi:YcxB family protein [Thalassotalea ponticola]|uniref:YcxB family protein n=1 Tax=Thalassotalea ponticola TaxID=1523392 RepID=UPI0025B465C7|nr:YcxB family protein [Thalassotalea ponticola]MDN3653728.1 YcxB family protein [Thalassotalea ponticola]
MTKFEHTFTLDKAHFVECFEQSASLRQQGWKRYSKALILFALGFFISAANIEKLSGHLGYFFYVLGLVEVLSVRFARGWWVTRQMFSKAAGNEVTLTIDQQGVHSKSDFVDRQCLWSDVERLIKTAKGLILIEKNGAQHYLSKAVLSEQSYAYICQQLQPSSSVD